MKQLFQTASNRQYKTAILERSVTYCPHFLPKDISKPQHKELESPSRPWHTCWAEEAETEQTWLGGAGQASDRSKLCQRATGSHVNWVSYLSVAESWAVCLGEVTCSIGHLCALCWRADYRKSSSTEQLEFVPLPPPPERRDFANDNPGMQLRHQKHTPQKKGSFSNETCSEQADKNLKLSSNKTRRRDWFCRLSPWSWRK